MFRLLRMWPSRTGLFSTVKCPRQERCGLLNCVFTHSQKRALSNTTELQTDASKRQRTNTQSPSISNAINKVINGSSDTNTDMVVIVPRSLPGVGAPAKHQQRIRFIAALAKAYTELGTTATPKKKAVDEEYKVACSSSSITYNSKMQSCLKSARNGVTPNIKETKNKLETFTFDELYKAVESIIHSKLKLSKYEYITEIPINGNHSNFDKKVCNRCKEQFLISDILEKRKCRYHERRKRKEGNDRYWECCSQLVGDSLGCKECDYHVFKAEDPIEMQELIPFIRTPEAPISSDKKLKNRIVGLDCEMGYTTKGFELLRLTVVDFYTGKTIFDEIIKPYGQILDYNTQWSGVSSIPPDSMTLDEMYDVIFPTIMDRDTIMIGHGLENDLNALRLIHYNVVDTSILFPKGLNNKFSLKDLSFQMLDRVIQTGEHSSEEDSLAAIDIVKYHIGKSIQKKNR